MKRLSNAAMQPILLKRHFKTNHADKMNHNQSFLQRLGKNIKRQHMNKTEKIQQKETEIAKASYEWPNTSKSLYDCRVACYASLKNLGQVSN